MEHPCDPRAAFCWDADTADFTRLGPGLQPTASQRNAFVRLLDHLTCDRSITRESTADRLWVTFDTKDEAGRFQPAGDYTITRRGRIAPPIDD